MKSVARIGSRVEMFIDDWLLERQQGTTLKLHPPERKEIVLTLDRPWEGPKSCYFTVLQESGLIRLYYRGYAVGEDDSTEQLTCYAESADGLAFHRPELGLYSFDGSLSNNILLKGLAGHNFCPFRDDSPLAVPEERYKAVGGVGRHPGSAVDAGLRAFASPDGIRWKPLQEEPIMEKGSFDSQNVAFWDRTIGKYRCYTRYFSSEHKVRAIQSSVSGDFRQWEAQAANVYAEDRPMEHFYTNATIPCPGAEHIYLSFPMRFVPERKKVAEHPHGGVSDAVLLTSRDGVHWDRTFAEAWCRPGPDPRNWTQRSGMVACGCAELAPGEWSFYISEHYFWDTNRLRRLAVRKHGLASLHSGAWEGQVVTRPLVLEGRHLFLNYATSAAGSIRVELQDESGVPLEGFGLDDMEPLYGDETDALVIWKSGADLRSWNGVTIRLRFALVDADLFALRAGEPAAPG